MTRYYPLTYGREIHIVLQMSTINSTIDDVVAAAQADAEGCDPKAHATLLQSIQKLLLAAETPSETAKRLLYQVSGLHDGLTLLTLTATYQHCHTHSRRVGIIRSREC